MGYEGTQGVDNKEMLKGKRILFSAGMQNDEKDIKRRLDLELNGFILNFAIEIYKRGGTIVHGCHPEITRLLVEALQRAGGKREQLLIKSASFFTQDMDFIQELEKYCLTELVLCPVPANSSPQEEREIALDYFRKEHLFDNIDYVLSAGGKSKRKHIDESLGIEEEFIIACKRKIPTIIMACFGGAAKNLHTYKPDGTNRFPNLPPGVTAKHDITAVHSYYEFSIPDIMHIMINGLEKAEQEETITIREAEDAITTLTKFLAQHKS